ncbi:MobF family relaxase [Methylobacterium sp. yr596]|uniref:MobF family relaxase n=1 Tax=Methylobacterium sp. yr596 TaxID=1761800 RepID=UPI0008E6085D|nr:MobF family relaxase [Methylobacterium sp. yr596]SFF72200.1 conjugative relaxase domain-containing protein, TrwC/TraI family [Methylobacterium sp. yr596]
MTASLHALGLGASAGTYYTHDPYREARNRDEYYVQDGGGRWWTQGPAVVRHGAPIMLESFRDLCAGLDPTTGRPLVRGAGAGHRAGWDLTLTAPKTLSLLWAASGPEQRAQLEAIHAAAVEEALGFLYAEELAEVRLGAGGQWREAPTGLMVGRFDHYTSRAGDPNCHTHCVLINAAASQDRKHRTLEPERLYHWQLVVGSAYRAALAERLTRELGLRLRPAGQGQFEIAGIPQTAIEAFSKRSAAIEARVGGDRAAASGAQKEIAALATRGAKADLPTGPALEARWRAELSALDLDPWRAVSEAARELAPEHEAELSAELPFNPPETAGTMPVARAASALFRHENVLSRKSLIERALDEAALQGLGLAAVRAELAELERSGQLVRLVRSERQACWTTPGIAAAEAALLRAADRPAAEHVIPVPIVEAVLSCAPQLAEEQKLALRHVSGAAAVSVLEAGAGTGKTTTAKALTEIARRCELQVIGLAPSWVAADELRSSTGIPAQAIAKWRHDHAQGAGTSLGPDSLVLVDEAGMVGTKDLAAILSAAEAGGARVVLVGDRRQLASVAGASALRAVTDVLGRHATLSQVRRQVVPWQRAASVLMARGEVEAGLRAYASRGCIDLVPGGAAVQERALALWSEARARHGLDAVLMVTRRNRDAAALNRGARTLLRTEGVLTGPDVEVTARDRENKVQALSLAVGERVRFGESLSQHGIRNGTRAVVEAIEPDEAGELRLRVRLEDGRQVEDAYAGFVPVQTQRTLQRGRSKARLLPRISLGYAGTAYAAQGRTCEATIYCGFTAGDARELYVGLTRHRQEARLVIERERLEAAVRVRQADPHFAPSTAELHERLFVEARRYSEKVNVVDHVEDRAAFVSSGAIAPARSELRLDLQASFGAARALRQVLWEIGTIPQLALRQLARNVRQAERRVALRVLRLIEDVRSALPPAVHRERSERSRSRAPYDR